VHKVYKVIFYQNQLTLIFYFGGIRYNNSTALRFLAFFVMCSMAISWINFSLHSLSGISKFNSAPCAVLDGVSMNNSYVVEWKKSLYTKFVSQMEPNFAKNNSLSVKAFKVLQFEVMINRLLVAP
jgi:hypothetical protein